jgi:hypothetical protein
MRVLLTSDCGEATSNAIHVTINKKPKAKVVAGGPTTFCDGDFVYLNELPTAGCTYLWQKDGTSIPGAVLNTYVATTTGNYRCIVTKTETGCFNTSNSIFVNVTCKTEISLNDQVNIFPNPANDVVNVYSSLSGVKQIKLMNAFGQLIQQTTTDEETVIFDVANLPAGFYIIEINCNNSIVQQTCIIE